MSSLTPTHDNNASAGGGGGVSSPGCEAACRPGQLGPKGVPVPLFSNTRLQSLDSEKKITNVFIYFFEIHVKI